MPLEIPATTTPQKPLPRVSAADVAKAKKRAVIFMTTAVLSLVATVGMLVYADQLLAQRVEASSALARTSKDAPRRELGAPLAHQAHDLTNPGIVHVARVDEPHLRPPCPGRASGGNQATLSHLRLAPNLLNRQPWGRMKEED